jgi:predicted DNA-binding protein YlxM (UPF0122 family)
VARRPPADDKLLEKVVRIGHLMDAYGSLLTDKQQKFMRLHYEEDLSFGEVARDFGVSRQAIHDAVKHAERSLEEYEARLGLLRRGRRGEDGTGAEMDQIPGGGAGQAVEVLEATIRRLRSAGVIYRVDWIVGDLRRAVGLLQGGGASDEDGAEAI